MGMKTVSEFKHPGIPVPASDALTDVLREGARRMLREAVEAEVQEFLTCHASLKDGSIVSGWCGTAIYRNGRSRQGWGTSPSRRPVCGTERERSDSRPRSFRPT